MASISFAAAKQMFEERVTEQYQNKRKLKGLVSEIHDTTGYIYNIPINGVGEMSELGFAAQTIPVSALNQTNVAVTQGNFYYKTAINGGYQKMFAFSQVEAHVEAHALAMGRSLDKLVLDELYVDNDPATAFGTPIAITVGYNQGFNTGKLTAALATLHNAGVDDIPIKSIIQWGAIQSLNADTQFVNWDFNSDRPLMESPNNIKSWQGVDIYMLGTAQSANSIPPTAPGSPNNFYFPALAENSMKVVYTRAPQTTVWYNPGEDRTEVLSFYTARAKVVQATGIQMMECVVPGLTTN